MNQAPVTPASDRPLAAITVAGIIPARDDHFLMVEERIAGEIRLNQPAGHVEPGESIVEAAIREVREETGYDFRPEALLGLYHSNPAAGRRILRVAVIGSTSDTAPSDALDDGIIAARFMPIDEIQRRHAMHRSPFVSRCIADFRAGQRHSLDLLHFLTS